VKRPARKFVMVLMIAALVGACATSYQPLPPFSPVAVDAVGYAPKANNALVILDASSSMGQVHQQWKKFDIAKAVVHNLAQTVPPDLGVRGGVRTFGHDHNFSRKPTLLIGEMGAFDAAAIATALATLPNSGGTSNLTRAIDAGADDLDGLGGRHALIIVSDGKDMGQGPVAAAAAIKQQFGDSLCIYPVLVGDDPSGQKLMDQIARAGGCGFALNAADLASGAQMAGFVKQVFVGAILDSDGDGVPDPLDQCPGTPAGVAVDAVGCPLDSDGDGVPDYLDQCPGTPAGVAVDAVGCPLTVLQRSAATWTFNDIHFAVAKSDINPASYGILNEIAAALAADPQLTVVVEGHTDITGTRDFNLALSQRRAQAVVDYLVGKGVAPNRLSAIGYGPDRPVADNATALGRSKNRRVQFTKVD